MRGREPTRTSMSFLRLLASLLLAASSLVAGEISVSLDPEKIIREVNLSRILGANAGLWYSAKQFTALRAGDHLKNWRPGLIRIPGGSWGDELVWNGNGVRVDGKVDPRKFVNGRWQVDYSAYAPGFRSGANGHPAEFHGNVDVRALHEFIRDVGSSAIVTVNAGTGTPEMAAEWVRWAKANHYPVAYWEIGNELEGKWEQGHHRPDGKEMTGEIYAGIYRQFATAMKAVDPTIKVGGPAASNDGVAFAAETLEEAGDLVDFISYHTYPANSHKGTPKLFEEANSTLGGMKKVRELIAQEAPHRVGKIEVGITEWHVGIHEGPRTVNQISGPWCAKWIGRMIESGVDFANVWDFFSATAQGGHGILGKDDAMTPRGAFWALQLWSQHMGGKVVATSVARDSAKAEATLSAFATKHDGRTALLLINENETEATTVKVSITGKAVSGCFQAHELSAASYLWNEHTLRPEWSHAPVQRVLTLDAEGRVSLPPLSATVLHLDQKSEPTAANSAKSLNVLIPARQPADVPFNAWITLADAKGAPFVGGPQQVSIETVGPLKAARTNTTLHSAAASVSIQPTGAGKAEIIARIGTEEVRRRIELVPVNFRPQVLWSFDNPDSLQNLTSPHQMELRDGAAVITLQKSDSNRLIEFKQLPGCEKPRIGGVALKLRATGLQAPANGKLSVVLLSQANHWMPLGDIPLSKIGPDWSQHELKLPDIAWREAMPDLYAVIILLQNAQGARGVIAVDDAGFLMRY